MNHIEKYQDFGDNEPMNEKISWKVFLFALGLAYTVPKYSTYNTLKNYYTKISDNRTKVSSKDSARIEEIRSEVISHIKESTRFKRFNKQFVIDSIQKIEIHIMENSYFLNDDNGKEHASGVYVNISNFKKFWVSGLTGNEPNIDNFIIVKRNVFDSSDGPDVITHELYHYLDALMGKGDTFYSTSVNISKFIDKKVYTKEGFLNKVNYMLIGNTKFSSNDSFYRSRMIQKHNYSKDWVVPDSIKNKIDTIFKDIQIVSNSIYGEYKYLSSDVEFYTRWKSFKHVLLRNGIIKKSNEKITKEKVLDYTNKFLVSERDLRLLIILDFDKIPEIDDTL